jgi:hypothetical protein
MPRYVILAHDHPFVHWDMMLEQGNVLRTWRLAAPPEPHIEVAAEAIGDHRLAYLDYEGPVSGSRGHVSCWDAGTYEWVEYSTKARLAGEKLNGELSFECLDGKLACRYRPHG